MEYRLRYREIPWHMVLFIPIGKIVGRCILDPVEYLADHPGKVIRYIFKRTAVVSLTALLIFVLMLALDISLLNKELGVAKLSERVMCNYFLDCRTLEQKQLDNLDKAMEANRLEKERLEKQRAADEQNMGEYETYRRRTRPVITAIPEKPIKKEVIATRPAPENYPEEGY